MKNILKIFKGSPRVASLFRLARSVPGADDLHCFIVAKAVDHDVGQGWDGELAGVFSRPAFPLSGKQRRI